MIADMKSDSIDANGAGRPMHPVLKNVLVFVIGALVGALCIFIFVTLHPPLQPQTSFCPQVPAALAPLGGVTAPARPVSTPPTAGIAAPPVTAAQPMASAAAIAESTTAQSATSTTASTQASASPSIPTERPTSALLIPVAGIKASQLTDTYTDARSGGRVHDAIDIMAPRGSQVIAADDGKVAKLFYSKFGGITLYQFDPTEKFVYYYAHMDSYAPGMIEGKQLHRGDLVGFVGSTGDASATAPHLHFAISVLGPEKHWWQATAINPYPLLSGR